MRYRRRSRFRKPFFKSRFWNASSENLVTGTVGEFTGSSAVALLGISPNLAQLTPTSLNSSFQYDQKMKLVGMQGSIPVWITQSEELVLTENEMGAASAPYVLFYVWKVIQMTADTLAVETATSNDPNPTGDLSTLLMGDDVLNWGHVHVPVWTYARNSYGIWTTNPSGFPYSPPLPTSEEGPGASSLFLQSSQLGRWFAYIPKPRIPKYGINLGRTRALVCYGRLMQWSLFGTAWSNPVLPAYYQPMLRARWER